MFYSFMKLICDHTGDKKAWLRFRGISVLKAISRDTFGWCVLQNLHISEFLKSIALQICSDVDIDDFIIIQLFCWRKLELITEK